jgi:hypothetical protein
LLSIYTSISPWIKKLFNVFRQLYSSSSDHVFFSDVIMAVWKFVEFQLPAHFTYKMKYINILNEADHNYFALQQFSFSISWLLIFFKLILKNDNSPTTVLKIVIQYLFPPKEELGTLTYWLLSFVFFELKAPATYPYPDPYYRSIFAPYDPQPYPPQPYGAQPMVIYLLILCQDLTSWSRKSRFWS